MKLSTVLPYQRFLEKIFENIIAKIYHLFYKKELDYKFIKSNCLVCYDKDRFNFSNYQRFDHT